MYSSVPDVLTEEAFTNTIFDRNAEFSEISIQLAIYMIAFCTYNVYANSWSTRIFIPLFHEVRWIWLFNVTFKDISVIYVTAHRYAGGLKKKLNLRSGSQRHIHFVGFFNVPVQAPTRDPPFYGYSEKPLFHI